MGFDVDNAIGLVIATAVLGFSPGPAVFATVAHALKLSLRQTYLFVSGIVLADFLFAVVAMLGAALLIEQYSILFYALKIGGGGYLIYLGVRTLFPQKKSGSSSLLKVDIEHSPSRLVLGGFLLTASNPKDLLFFVSFLPAFIDLQSATLTQMLVAAALIVVTFIFTLSSYVLFSGLAKTLLDSDRFSRVLDYVAGSLLVIVGLTVLFSH